MFDTATNYTPLPSHSFSLTPEEFNDYYKNVQNKPFSISHINIRSLNKNLDSFKLFYRDIIEHDFSNNWFI